MMLWLLAFCVFAVFSLCPLARLATRYNLTAGGPSDDTFYINAPVFVAGETNRDETKGSASTTTGKLNSSAKNHALFKTDGTVDEEVLTDLLNMLDDSKVKESSSGTGDVKYYSAKNFGQYGNLTGNKAGNAQILVKLFETTTNSTSNINSMTGQYWQAVYRSVNGKNDVLTLYMTHSYLNNPFNKYNSSKIKYGNYSTSDIRDVILADYTTLTGKFSQADKYIVAPYQLSSSGASDMSKTAVESGTYFNLGGWQSSAYQTSSRGETSVIPSITNKNQWMSGTTDEIHLGASGYADLNYEYAGEYGINNGLDGLGDGWSSWSSIDSSYTDKLWLPSGFEVLHTGYEPQTGATLSRYDGDNDIIYLNKSSSNGEIYSSAKAIISPDSNTSSHTNTNRTGLWELNAYDRAADATIAWLRSGISNIDKYARGIDEYGDVFGYEVDTYVNVRVALHLNLCALKSLLPSEDTALNLSATNNAANSLLVLTVMDGNARIAEFSCISGTITATIILDKNKTYKILATRPFGSSMEVKLDDVLQSPTVFACYEIQTAENDQMNITFTLTGDGSWKNCVVI